MVTYKRPEIRMVLGFLKSKVEDNEAIHLKENYFQS